MSEMVCLTCGHVGRTKKEVKGHFALEVILWVFVVTIPFALLYSIWRVVGRKRVCASCGSQTVVPINSPAGLRMMAANTELAATLSAKSAES